MVICLGQELRRLRLQRTFCQWRLYWRDLAGPSVAAVAMYKNAFDSGTQFVYVLSGGTTQLHTTMFSLSLTYSAVNQKDEVIVFWRRFSSSYRRVRHRVKHVLCMKANALPNRELLKAHHANCDAIKTT